LAEMINEMEPVHFKKSIRT